MRLFLFGTDHRIAPGDLRERVFTHADPLRRVLGRLTGPDRPLREGTALVTCARFEVYGVTDRPERVRRLLGRVSAREAGIELGAVDRVSYFRTGPDVVRHLFRVAAGLDSAVQGEAQILGQVRALTADPHATGTMGPRLHRLVQSAVAAGKRVRTETGIGQGAASLAGAALALAERRLGGFRERSALVLGAGDTGGLVARMLRKKGVRTLRIANRSLAAAETLATELGASAHSLDELVDLLGDVDLVVGAATVTEPLLDRATATTVWNGAGRTRFLIDLGHPRTIAADMADMDGVELMDLDQVLRRVESARVARAAQAPRAEEIVEEEARRYDAWLRSRRAVPVVRAMRERVLGLARDEAERHGRGLDEAQRRSLERFARSLARTLLHEPTVALREADPSTAEGQRLIAEAERLFGLQP